MSYEALHVEVLADSGPLPKVGTRVKIGDARLLTSWPPHERSIVSSALQVQVLADSSRPSKVGTRVTRMPRDLLANCSFDTDDNATGEDN